MEIRPPVEMLSGLPINISTAFLIFISEWGILSVEKQQDNTEKFSMEVGLWK